MNSRADTPGATPVDRPSAPLGVLAVLVVYERDLTTVAPWPRLMQWLDAVPAEATAGFRLDHVLVYDNSLKRHADPCAAASRVTYVHDPTNGGTRAAYAHAAQLAQAMELSWLLLLDHDTTLPADFLVLAGRARGETGGALACAWLPVVMAHGQRISPAIMHPSGIVKPLLDAAAQSSGRHCVTGIASGALFSVAVLIDSAPPPTVWLDGVDHWHFLRLHRQGWRVGLFDAVVEHELSVMDYSTLSAKRARNILSANHSLLTALPWQAALLYPLRVLWFIGKLVWRNPRAALDLGLSLLGQARHHG